MAPDREVLQRPAPAWKTVTAALAVSAAVSVLMVAVSATAAAQHLPEVYWPDTSTRHDVYGVLAIMGLLGSLVTVPGTTAGWLLYRAARNRTGPAPRSAAVLGSILGTVVSLGLPAAVLLTP